MASTGSLLSPLTWSCLGDVQAAAVVTGSAGNGEKRSAAKRAVATVETVQSKLFDLHLRTLEAHITIRHTVNPLTRRGSGGGLQNIDWDIVPAALTVEGGKLPPIRSQRKRQQLENMALLVKLVVQPGDTVVDFCGGCGHVGLLVAVMCPAARVVIVDMNATSIELAARRVADAGLTNVRLICGRIEQFTEPFQVGCALHACGEATDITLAKCVEQRAKFVVCPCCVGKIKLSKLEYPRSTAMQALLDRDAFEEVARAADFGSWESCQTPIAARRRLCKSMMERDRALRCEEAGYETRTVLMDPVTASPKHDVIVGWPIGTMGPPELTTHDG